MEMSSPLAAMRPPPIPGPWGYRHDLAPSRPLLAARSMSSNFNFRDLSMHSINGMNSLKKGSVDYFSLQPMRGSSPTASLAADMSSNLHVDQSPQFATPRRSLFTSNMAQRTDSFEGATSTPVRWEGITTPPIPSSSPNFVPDSMDISPLPHKAPFSFLDERCQPLPSPSPETTPSVESDMLIPCDLPTPPQVPTPMIEVTRPVSATERRKSILNRPSLSRTKNYSTNTVSFKQQENSPLQHSPMPPFKFGAGPDCFMNSSTPSLDECFNASPPQERRPTSNGSLFASKPRSFNFNSNVLLRASGSPLAAAVRKPAGPRRTKFRRSLSMFEHPGDVMTAKPDQDQEPSQSNTLESVMDIDDEPSLKLPHFIPTEPKSLPRISPSTLVEVLDGAYDSLYDNKVIIDCRFEYEYNGGHIAGALNFCEKEKLAKRLFQAESSPRTLLILHCEYSAHRAPLMAQFVRSHDRKENEDRYPALSFPEVYILDGGYSSFYHAHSTRCFPQNYLRMDAKEHEQSCERGLNKLRQRVKLSRAQTFAFGQQSCQMEDSPTGLGRSRSGGIFTLGDDSPYGRIGASRRMASY